MSNSSLITYTDLSPNHSGTRTQPISRFTPHCFVGQVTVERGCKSFEDPKGNASCNYLIGCDGRKALVVPEGFRSWCTSSAYNDQRAITVEVASDNTAPYKFNDAAYNSLIELAIDCCKRNKKDTFVYIPDKTKALAYKPKDNEMLMTFHCWYAKKICPGQWFIDHAQDFTDKVNAGLKGYTEVPLYHKAKAGDSLSKIAKQYGITLAQIKKLNPDIKGPMYIVKIGKQVRVK